MTLHELWNVLAPPGKRPLGILIVFSIALHASIFFIFKVAHSRPVTPATPHQPRIMMMSSEFEKRDGGKEIRSWIDMMDPMVIAIPRTKPTLGEIKATAFPDAADGWPQIANPLPAIPSRAKAARPIESLGEIAELASESLNDYGPIPMPIMVETPPPIGGSQSSIEGSLSARAVVQKEALPQPRATITLRSTVLRVGIDGDGDVIHVLVDESSGDSAVDLLALKTIRNWRFTPQKNQAEVVDWGKITVFWDQQPPQTSAQTPKS